MAGFDFGPKWDLEGGRCVYWSGAGWYCDKFSDGEWRAFRVATEKATEAQARTMAFSVNASEPKWCEYPDEV